MFDQLQHFTDIAQNFQPAQWGAQIQEQFQQHFPQQVQQWVRPEAAPQPERAASFSS